MHVFDILWAPAVLLLLISCLESYNAQQIKSFGDDETLSLDEYAANRTIMDAKAKEYPISKETFAKLNESTLFQYISNMPKGAYLHAHDRAMCSIDCILNITYLPKAMICESTADEKIVKLIFSTENYLMHENNTVFCVQLKRRRRNESTVADDSLREQLSLDPMHYTLDLQNVSKKIEKINSIVDSLLLYATAWKKYFYRSLEELLADGVQYVEFRSAFPIMYDLKGKNYKQLDFVRICKKVLDKFMKKNPDFIGCKLIYAPPRADNKTQLEEYKNTYLNIKTQYPDFVAGFDVSSNLRDFTPELSDMRNRKDLFLHSNWFVASKDDMRIDGALLYTQRIDHAFALINDRLVWEHIHKNNIAVEILPLMYQLLGFVSDNPSHPCSHLFDDNYPIVVSSEYPSIWNLKPLSNDFLTAFLRIAPFGSDLKVLKKLAKNSIKYSSLNETQKADAMQKWASKWQSYMALFNLFG